MEIQYTKDALRKRIWREKNKEKYQRDNRRRSWKRYGMDVDSAQELWDNKKCCAICGETEGQLCVDHCHTSLEIRGILCRHCNHVLGLFKEDLNLFKKAADYLIKHMRKEEKELNTILLKHLLLPSYLENWPEESIKEVKALVKQLVKRYLEIIDSILKRFDNEE